MECPTCGIISKVPPGGVKTFPSDSFSWVVRKLAYSRKKDVNLRSGPPLCHLHPGEVTSLYCRPCRLACCRTCVISDEGAHYQHRVAALSDIVQHLDKLFKDTLESLTGMSSTMTNQMNTLKETEKRMEMDLESLKENATKLCGSIFVLPTQKTQLTEKVEDLERTAKEKYTSSRDKLQVYIADLDALKSYGTTLRDKGTLGDKATHIPGVIRHAHAMKTPPQIYMWRTPQLPHFDQAATSYFKGDITPLTFLELKEFDVPIPLSYPPQSFYLDPTSKYDLPGSVLGLVILFDHIIVARSRYQVLHVYTKEGKLHRKLPIPGLKDPRSLAVVDPEEGRIVIGDHSGCSLHWVRLDSSLDLLTHGVLKLEANPTGLCLDNSGRVMVTADDLLVCMQADDSGQLIRDVRLTKEWWPTTPVRTSHDCIAIRDRASSYHIFYVDDEGNYIMYEQPGLNSPRYMVPFNDQYALAADRGDQRFVLMGPFPGPLLHSGGATVNTDKYESHYQRLLTHNILTIKNQSYDITCLYVDQKKSVIYICQERGRQTLIKTVRFDPSYSVTYMTIALAASQMPLITNSMLQLAMGPEGKKPKKFVCF